MIELRGLRAAGTRGALPEEQERPQPFEVDLDLEVDLSRRPARPTTWPTPSTTAPWPTPSSRSSRPSGSRCSNALAGTGGRRRAGRRRRIDAVTVAVRKLRPPVPQQLDDVGRAHPARRPLTCGRFLGLGSNLGDREAVPPRGGRLAGRRHRRVAGVRDRAGGRARDQGAYLNLVVELDTDLDPPPAARSVPPAGVGRRPGARRAVGAAHPRRRRALDRRRADRRRPTSTVPHPRCSSAGSCSPRWRELAPDLVVRRVPTTGRRAGHRVGRCDRDPRCG